MIRFSVLLAAALMLAAGAAHASKETDKIIDKVIDSKTFLANCPRGNDKPECAHTLAAIIDGVMQHNSVLYFQMGKTDFLVRKKVPGMICPSNLFTKADAVNAVYDAFEKHPTMDQFPLAMNVSNALYAKWPCTEIKRQ